MSKCFQGALRGLHPAHDRAMGRIGKTYPRFQDEQPAAGDADERGVSGLHVFGALVGVIAALGLIGFILTR